MKIAVLGAGAMGSAFGAFLVKAGQDVCLIDVRKEHIDSIQAQGLTLITDGSPECVSIKAAHDAQEASALLGGTADVILVFVKTTVTETALAASAALIGANTYLVTTQNGLGSEEILARYVPQERVIVGTSAFSASVETAGTVQYVPRPGWISHIMPLAGAMNAVCEELASALTAGGHPTHATMDTQITRWKKVAINCVGNAASALTRLKSDVILSSPDGEAYTRQIVSEVLQVAAAEGVALRLEDVAPQIEVAATLPWYPSMGLDSIHHRQTEIGSLNGAIMQLGRKHGIATPANKVMYHLVRVLEDHYDQLPEGM